MRHRAGMVVKSFAGPLKKALCKMLKLSKDQLYGHLKEEVDAFWGHSPREIMQRFGTEVCREYLPSLLPGLEKLWLRRMELEILKAREGCYQLVIDDVRFADEAALIHRYGGQVFRILRRVGGSSSSPDAHATEAPLPDADLDATILNLSGLEELWESLHSVLTNGEQASN